MSLSLFLSLYVYVCLYLYLSLFQHIYIAQHPALTTPLIPLCPSFSLSLQGQCGYSDCMKALAINLGIIFGMDRMTNAAN